MCKSLARYDHSSMRSIYSHYNFICHCKAIMSENTTSLSYFNNSLVAIAVIGCVQLTVIISDSKGIATAENREEHSK